MAEHYSERRLRERLMALNVAGRLTFALSCAERMLPNYRRFVRENDWGDPLVLREALDLGWSWLENHRISSDAARRLRDACFEQAPHTEDFSSILVSSALDAANSAANIAELLIEPDVEKAVEIASYGRDTVDMYVQELEDMPPNAPDLEERIRRHEMMQRELTRQREAIEAIEAGIQPEDAARRWLSPELGSIDSH